ncbi:hypothetical protein KAR91_56855 [Candidatus Pacearchaeota archaeon]|nr:hypothetical protein [Candidatus Pacearchaeota archaeon]
MTWTNKFKNVDLAIGPVTPWPLPTDPGTDNVPRIPTTIYPAPIVKALRSASEIFQPPRNRFDMMDNFVEHDPELAAGIDIKASMVRRSFRGLLLRVGAEITPEEDVLNEYLKILESWLNLKRLFYVITKKLLTYGDWPMLKEVKGGIPRLSHLPNKYMSIVDNLLQLENVDAQIFYGNFYVLNEYREERRRIFHRNRILHFTIEPEGTEIYDQFGRYCFGVYSASPLLPLTQYILWKHNIIITDIMLRHKLVPREIHKVNTLGINPQTMGNPGDDIDTRIAKANAEITRVLSAYELSIAYVGNDRGYIVQGEAVDIDILEPKGMSYHKPNEVIDQINGAYARRLGIPESELMSTKTSAFAEALIKTSFSTIRTIDLSEVIADKLLGYVKEHIILTYPAYAHLVESIYFDIDLVMDQEEERRFRIASLMHQMQDQFTSTEIRQVAGYEKLTDEQQTEIDEMLKKRAENQVQTTIPGRTPGDTKAQSQNTRESDKTGFPDTPRQREKEKVGLEVYQ